MVYEKKWTLVICFFVHVLFLVSIFDIYFQSPIQKGVPHLENNLRAPAKRLVLFVGDGLRVDTCFEVRKNDTPIHHLRKVIETRGRWGISHTRVPTESRPGHVAIIAGFYEDPSAIFKGWKDNPIDFDSIFNRSSLTFGWGSPDIMSMFNKGNIKEKVFLKSYSSDFEEFTGSDESAIRTSLWTLEQFKILLKTAKTNDTLNALLNRDKIIFFFHLLGIDTAGHSHKPHSEEYINNIRVADKIVQDVEGLIRNFYNDDNTAFIFTSDHGMTDWGSHGEGSLAETETPFIAWGAGVRRPVIVEIDKRQPKEWNLDGYQRDDMKQADIAPLMSILLGISIPVNSLGTIPIHIVDFSMEEKSAAVILNARQILAQFLEKKKNVEKTTFKWLYRTYDSLSRRWDEVLQTLYTHVQRKSYDKAIEGSLKLISDSLVGLEYYQNYYQNFLLIFITTGYVGWIFWLMLNVSADDSSLGPKNGSRKIGRLIADVVFIILTIIVSILLFFLSLPLQYYLYCCLPVAIWWSVIRKLVRCDVVVHNMKSVYYSVMMFLLAAMGTEFVVLSFFERRALCVVILALSFWPLLNGKDKTRSKFSLTVMWMLSCLTLIVFPFLPIIGSTPNDNYITLCSVLWFLFISISILWKYITKVDSFIFNTISPKMFLIPLILFAVEMFGVHYASYMYSSKKQVPRLIQLFSWSVLLIVPAVPLFFTRVLIVRLLNIYFCLGVVSYLFSLTHEALFLPFFSFHLLLWLLHENMHHTSTSMKYFRVLRLTAIKFGQVNYRKRNLEVNDFRTAYFFFFYTVFSFFATGNIASINSFDVRSVRCFVTVFSPFTMMILMLVKIMIPFFVTACTFRAVNVVTKAPTDKIFFIVLVYCDLMGLNFLFLVKNVGSWLEIGSSVSHYVISQTIIIFLVFLYFLSSFVTSFKIRHLNVGTLIRYNKSRYIE